MKRKFLALILAALCAATSSVCFTACNTNDVGKGSDNTENNQPEITKLQEYDLSGISFNDKSVTYDGNFHSVEIVGDLPQGVSVSYTGGGTNAGEYTVTAKFAGDTVTHKPIADITAKLTIIKAPFMGEISFSGAQFDYDGEAQSITITGNLPEGIAVTYEYKNGTGEVIAPENVKEIGEYTVTAVFTSENYQPISSLTAVLKIVGQTLYDESGNLNYAVFANTLEQWMNNGYYLKKFDPASKQASLTIDYVSVDEHNKAITFGCYVNATVTGLTYSNFKISSTDLVNNILNGNYATIEELTEYFFTVTGRPIERDGVNASFDMTISDEDISTMAENILKRLQEVGYQGASINNEGTKVTDYAGATVLSVRKDKDIGGNSAYYMGTVYDTDFYITILKSNGEHEILTFGVSYSTLGASQNIINKDITSKSWIIRNFNSKEIDYCPYA